MASEACLQMLALLESSPIIERNLSINPAYSVIGLFSYVRHRMGRTQSSRTHSPRKYWSRKAIAEWLVERLAEDAPTLVGELWLILGDGVNQAADFFSDATSIPSRNVTPLTTFGN
jgi:hypothetical protein